MENSDRGVDRSRLDFSWPALGCGTADGPELAGGEAGQELLGRTCTPEVIPGGGFDRSKIYLETGSASCESRVCLVYHLGGDLRMRDCDEPGCVDSAEADMRMFCSCRCSGEEGSRPLCDCPTGFACVSDVTTVGGEGVVGSYCIRDELAKSSRAEVG